MDIDRFAKLIHREADREKDRQTGEKRDRQTDRQMNRRGDSKTNRQSAEQTKRQTDLSSFLQNFVFWQAAIRRCVYLTSPTLSLSHSWSLYPAIHLIALPFNWNVAVAGWGTHTAASCVTLQLQWRRKSKWAWGMPHATCMRHIKVRRLACKVNPFTPQCTCTFPISHCRCMCEKNPVENAATFPLLTCLPGFFFWYWCVMWFMCHN